MTALDAADLRALQKPLKDAYRSDPASALNASRAVARLGGDGIDATVMGVQLRDAEVVVEGRWDARGTLGVDRDAPVGLTDVTLTFRFDTDADDATADKLVELAERYCVVAQTLRTPPPVKVRREPATTV